jgi:type I restriction enzyme S subunit
VFAWEQAVAVLSENERGFIASHRFPMFQGRKNQASEAYYLLFFKTRRGKEQLTIASPGGAGRNKTLGQADLDVLPVPCPPFPEQIAIAEMLACWDKAIQTLELKIGKKRLVKQGLTRKLLSGQTRMPGFSKPRKTVRLKEIAKLSAGGTPSTTHSEYWGGNIPWMCSGDLNLRRVFSVEGRITEIGLKNSSTKFVPKHSVLIGLAGQGKTRGTVAINEIELCTNQSVASITPDVKKAFYEYLYVNLDSRYEELRRLSAGDGGRGGLNLSLLGDLSIVLPPIEEQRAIAEVLTAADAEIEALEQKLVLFKSQKKYLLNNLVTGTIRLPQFCKAARKGDRHE